MQSFPLQSNPSYHSYKYNTVIYDKAPIKGSHTAARNLVKNIQANYSNAHHSFKKYIYRAMTLLLLSRPQVKSLNAPTVATNAHGLHLCAIHNLSAKERAVKKWWSYSGEDILSYYWECNKSIPTGVNLPGENSCHSWFFLEGKKQLKGAREGERKRSWQESALVSFVTREFL